MIDGELSKLDKYMMNSDIAGFLGKCDIHNAVSQVISSPEMLDIFFENSINITLVLTFLSQFWNSWETV